MKKAAFALTVSACFIGVFGALQANKWLEKKASGDDVFSRVASPTARILPAFAPEVPAAGFDFRAAAKKVMPSVVSVDRFDRRPSFFNQDGGSVSKTGTGSGVIVSTDGVIVTNNHVVEGQLTRAGKMVYPKVQVRLFDGRKLSAKVLGSDPRSDIAVLKVEANNLQPAEIGSSNSLEVGEWVMAVGNPLGFDNTVSVGVVSSTKRDLPVGEQGLVEGIQTDAAINPGNSGGALTNSQGQLIGINSAIASGTGESVGIGFAIPIDRARKIVNDIVKFGEPRYAGLGVQYVGQLAGQLSNPYAREYVSQQIGRSDFPETGLFIQAASGPAATAGIKANDFILAIDGKEIESTFDLNKAIVTKKAGDKVKVKIWSAGATKELSVTLADLKPTI